MGKPAWIFFISVVFMSISVAGWQESFDKQTNTKPTQQWKIHDPDRPLPPVVNPGPAGDPVPAPSDAVILFNGRDLSQWSDSKGQPAQTYQNRAPTVP